jgi:CTP synthase (UTP-ammonia lyase)
MGLADADSAEHATSSRNIIIAPVACPVPDRRAGAPKLSGACRLRIQPGCRLAAIYKASEVEEEYFCNFEVNRQYLGQLESSGMRLSAFDDNGELRAIELPEHRFFVATLYQPQLSSTEERPHPLIVEFLAASAGLVKSPA